MPISGYVKIDDIKGESKRADHEEEIDVHSISWNVAQRSSANLGSGRSRGRAEISDISVRKFTDAASPYLAQAAMQGKSLPEIVIMARKDSGDTHLDYLQFTLTNAAISGFRILPTPSGTEEQLPEEEVSFTAEKIKMKYVTQADDHSAGAEHEFEYDLVAGA
ncbi:hypothetical protein Rumeso_01999 [Rubellimicrobium mesophilum DSM 19309]|uniref:Cytoplasmic protein USSDB7A n=1 Tax=Rubellimicrobium mesophilum DSM 19309 TaxID=442562 RepID=A0A017HPY9_9RHOB|nr:type VI secretion system tube protein Hcp [Rubellimicrobium mesophilum]EYD76441.1 hypothetical protein Rumeso_01999 [Rubellimicrobium mesophilum DSM 19309]